MSGSPQVSAAPITVDGRYIVEEKVHGRGAWSVVRTCRPIAPYQPPNTKLIAGDENIDPAAGPGKSPSALNSADSSMELVAKVISKAHVTQLAGGNEENGRANVNREVDILRLLPPHPNVARFIEFLEDDDNYYIIFEAAPKGDLCDLILQSQTNRIPEAQAKQFAVEVIRAVLHCHRYGCAHRDIKPENLLVGAGNVLKLTDFGLAKVMKPGSNDPDAGASPPRSCFDFLHTATDPITAAMYPSRLWVGETGATASAARAGVAGASSPGNSKSSESPTAAPFYGGHEIVGTLRYGAPEMFQAKFERGVFDAFAADTWSVGVVVYIMLTGSFPFSAGQNATERETYKILLDTAVSPPSYLSPAASDFLLRILTKNPEKRMTLWDALDHRWLRDVVERNDSAARASLRFRRTEPTQDPTTVSAPPAVTLPPSLVRLRALIDRTSAKLSPMEADVLRAAFDDVLVTFDSQAIANGRLRALALHSTSAPTASGPSTSSSTGSARRGIASPSPASNRASSGQRASSTGRSATPTGSVRQPSPSPAVRRVPPVASTGSSTGSNNGGAAPAARQPSPNGSANGSHPRTLTPTRRAIVAPTNGASTGPALAPPARRTGTPTNVARRQESPSKAPMAAVVTVQPRTSSAQRPSSGTSTGAQVRQASPLSRASPVQRRGTPLRTGVASTTAPPSSTTAAVPRRAPPAPPSTVSGTSGTATSAAPATNFVVGETTKYKDNRAIIRFVGETTFAGGQWVGLEMLEGNEGIHDGTSSVDKRRYFTCPNGRGVFVRPSQVQPA